VLSISQHCSLSLYLSHFCGLHFSIPLIPYSLFLHLLSFLCFASL
jgi:hypothetical protein